MVAKNNQAHSRYFSADTRSNLAWEILAQNRTEEAHDQCRKAIETYCQLPAEFLQNTHWRTEVSAVLNEFVRMMRSAGKRDDLAALLHQIVDFYKRLSAECPSEPAFRTDLARFLGELGRVTEAKAAFLQALQIQEGLVKDFPAIPQHRNVLAWTHHDLASFLQGKNQPQEAAQHFASAVVIWEKLSADVPREPRYQNHAANAIRAHAKLLTNQLNKPKEAEEQHRRALRIFEKLAAEFPNQSGYTAMVGYTYSSLGWVLSSLGRPVEATAAFRNGVGTFEKLSAVTPGERGEYLAQLGHCRRMVAFCVWDAGQTEEAEQLLGKALSVFEKLSADYPGVASHRHFLADTHRHIGRLLTIRKQFPKAEKAYRLSIEIQQERMARLPEQPVNQDEVAASFFDLGALLANMGREQEAKSILQKYLKPLDKAIELAPKNLPLHLCRGRAYAELEEWQNAATAFEHATTLKPDSPVAWYNLALVELQRGDRAGYRKVCSRMLERFGPSASADHIYWMIWTCVLAPDAVADWTKLLSFVEKAHADDGKNYDTVNHLGAVLYRAGRFQEAAQRLVEAEAAFQQTPSTRSTIVYNWFFQAMAHHRLGHTTEAASWLKKAVQDIDEPSPKTAQVPTNNTWNRRLTLQLLRREAEELLKEEPGVHKQQSEKKPN
jgi:tetratricopeptide (TPR) repeat protein